MKGGDPAQAGLLAFHVRSHGVSARININSVAGVMSWEGSGAAAAGATRQTRRRRGRQGQSREQLNGESSRRRRGTRRSVNTALVGVTDTTNYIGRLFRSRRSFATRVTTSEPPSTTLQQPMAWWRMTPKHDTEMAVLWLANYQMMGCGRRITFAEDFSPFYYLA